MKELAKEYAGKITIYKVNVDKQKELAALFNATSIPLFVFIPMKGDPGSFSVEQAVKQLTRKLSMNFC